MSKLTFPPRSISSTRVGPSRDAGGSAAMIAEATARAREFARDACRTVKKASRVTDSGAEMSSTFLLGCPTHARGS
jgi:hypothetical protein